WLVVLKAISAPGQNGITAAGTVADSHGIPLQPVFDKTGLPYSTANIGQSFCNLQTGKGRSVRVRKAKGLSVSVLYGQNFCLCFLAAFFNREACLSGTIGLL